MPTTRETQEIITWILTIGTLLATILVLIGGSLFLYLHGSENRQLELLTPTSYYNSLTLIWNDAISLKPLGIIGLGILTLIITQLLRVALLIWFYLSQKDYWFTIISIFVLSTMLYSFFVH